MNGMCFYENIIAAKHSFYTLNLGADRTVDRSTSGLKVQHL